jgi:hypothetical protein
MNPYMTRDRLVAAVRQARRRREFCREYVRIPEGLPDSPAANFGVAGGEGPDARPPDHFERSKTMVIRESPTNPVGWMTLLLALSWPAVGQPPSIATRLDQLKAKGVNAEITVFPVGLAERPGLCLTGW